MIVCYPIIRMLSSILRSKFTYWILTLYFISIFWWLRLQITSSVGTSEAYIYNWFYGFIGLSGGIYGLLVAAGKWGGWGSMIGKGITFLSAGLLAQWFGLQVWTYYNIIASVEVPYPSLADIGYFGLIPAYTAASLVFAIASGAKFSLYTLYGKLWGISIPIVALTFAYAIFLKDVGIDFNDPLRTFLDLGYPFGEIVPVSIAMFTLTLSRSFLGGIMKSRILYLIVAFFAQFITEYTFLYMAGKELYVNGGISDIMYPTSYTIMILGLVAFRNFKNNQN